MSKHPWLRRLAIAFAICVVVVVAFMVFLLLIQPTLNLSPFKGTLEAQLSGLAGAPVTLEELYLTTSLEPSVEIRQLQVADLAGAETTQLQIELIPLLKRHISIESLKLDQVTVQVRPALELAKEWLGEDDRPQSPYRVDALENLEFDRVQLDVTDDLGVDHRLVIDECDGGITRKSPLRLEARGSFNDEALQFKAGGPTLEEFFNQDSTLPLEAALDIAGASLFLEGTLNKQINPPTLALAFDLEGGDLEATLAAGGVRVPALGSFQLQGSLTRSGGPVHLTALEGRIGEAELSGDLELNFESEKFRLDGRLDTGRIDLRPWLEPRPAQSNPDTEKADSSERLLDRPLPVETIEKILAATDLDLEVAIDGLEGLPTTVENVTGQLSLEDAQLTLPYGLQLGGALVQGQVEVASAQGLIELALELSSSTLPLDRLAEDLGQGLATGTVGQVHLAASSSGTTVGDLIHQVAFHLETGDAQIRFRSLDNDKKVDLVLTHMEATRSLEAPLRAILDGDLRGYPYRIDVMGQESKDWRSDDPWPFTLTAEGLGARTRIQGRLTPKAGAVFLDLELESSGDRIGDLEPWWGVPATAAYPYKIQGRLKVEPDRRELRLDTIRIGQTAATMNLLFPQHEAAPILVDLDASTIALDELMHLVASGEKDLALEPVFTVDIPIWTDTLTLPDTEAHIELDRVLRNSAELADLSDVVAEVEIRESRLERAMVTLLAEEASLRGELDLDWRAEPPEMYLELGGEELDLGRLLALDEVARGLAVRAARFDLQVTAAEKTLRQMFLEGATTSGRAEDVFLSAPSLNKEVLLELTLDQAAISESPGKPIQVSADGHLSKWPVDLELTVHNKSRTGPEEDHVPIELALRTGDVHLETKGEVTLPARAENLDLSFSLTADRISSFEPFIGHRISEVGPVAATGEIMIRPDNYALKNLSIEVGKSDVNGKASLDSTGERPRIAADLSSRRVHLAELLAHAWAPDEDQGETAKGSAVPDEDSDEEEMESWLEKLESSKLANMDLDLNLQADDIYWGGETGGGGRIRLHSEQGRLEAGPFRLALADGRVEGHVVARADSGLLDADLELRVYDVEYGPIARFLDPGSEGQGIIDLETRLTASSAPAGELISKANGHFRFALFPSNVDTTLLNFWGAGLFRSMFRLVDPTDKSVLNCMAADFSATDGVLTANEFWFDTSRIRARGKGTIDLQQMTIDMTLRPRPKKRTFLTLATPAKIKGPVEDPSITLSKGGLVGTSFRFYMWVLTLYAQILKKPLPTDGSDVCFLPPPPETVENPVSESAAPPSN